MNEKDMNRLMMIAGAALAMIAGLGAVGLIMLTAAQGLKLILPAILLGVVAVGAAYGATFYGRKAAGHEQVFPNEVEREVLSTQQRRELKRARGELVMERALVDIENERQNIVHKQIEASNDPDKPPHQTALSPNANGGIVDGRKPLPPRKSFDDEEDFPIQHDHRYR